MTTKQWLTGTFVLFLLTFFTAAALATAESTDPPPIKALSATPTPPIDWSTLKMPPQEPGKEAVADPLFGEAQRFSETPFSENEERPSAETAPDNEREAPPAVESAPVETTTYTVQPGDSLYKIARRFHVSLETLISVNQIANRKLIHPGQVLLLPGSGAAVKSAATVAGESTYVVQRGDTVYKIARRFGLSWQKLAAANHLSDPSRLDVGQVLVLAEAAVALPTPQPTIETAVAPSAGDNEYVVQQGDNPYRIARRLGIDVQALLTANNITNPHRLQIGQKLVIPAAGAPAPAATPAPTAQPPPENNPPPEPPPEASRFIWPVEGRHIYQYFRYGHGAIDIASPVGSPVVAAAGGTVEFAGWNNYGYGNLVVVDHGDGSKTLYAHNDSFNVETGQQVAQGDSLAMSGNTGRSTHPHVHFSIILNGRLTNPCDLLPGGC